MISPFRAIGAVLCALSALPILFAQTGPIQPPQTGKVYLFRGFAGVWSGGLDTLAQKLQSEGLTTSVDSHTRWRSAVDTIVETRQKPVILVGHSYGADAILQAARRLEERNVPVDLLITFDPVVTAQVPANVKVAVNFHCVKTLTQGLPWWRGIRLDKAPGSTGYLENIDVKTRPDIAEAGLTHATIDDSPGLHRAVIELVKKTMKGQN